MPDESEVIRQQMEGTRTALATKLESLEQQVTESVTAATDTVASVKDVVEETVETVKDSVQETVATLKDTVHDTVETVKSTFDVAAHVERHPWLSLGTSVLAGYLAGRVLNSGRGTSGGAVAAPPASNGASYSAATNGNGKYAAMSSEYGRSESVPTQPAEKGWLQTLGDEYSGELAKLKGLAVGAVLGLVRDSLVRSAPEALQPPLAEVMDTLTVKLGGQKIDERILDTFRPGEDSAETSSPADQSRASTPSRLKVG